eukprot:5027409-Amphidinium_carterae.1
MCFTIGRVRGQVVRELEQAKSEHSKIEESLSAAQDCTSINDPSLGNSCAHGLPTLPTQQRNNTPERSDDCNTWGRWAQKVSSPRKLLLQHGGPLQQS